MEMVQVVLIDLPVTVRGLTVYYYDEDGQVYYTILINSRLNDQTQCAAYDHEIVHINNRDFDCMLPVEDLEAARHDGYAV